MKKLACLLALMFMLTQASAVQAEGILYTESTFPKDTSLQTKYSTKMGKATCYNVLGLVEWGNCGLHEAMKNGGISQVHHYDVQSNGWIFFKKIHTHVYGY